MKEKVYEIVSHVMDVPIEILNDDSSPDNIDNWDSLKHINLVLALEQEFNHQFTPEQISEMANIGLINLILEEGINNKV